MAIYYRRVDNFIIISGKTYPYKDLIKSLGGRFLGQDKVWSVPASDNSLAELKSLCKSVGGGPLKVKSPQFIKSPSASSDPAPPEPSAQAQNLSFAGLSISELVQSIHIELQKSFPRSIWIYGEIQSMSLRKNAAFLQIADFKDEGSRSNTVTLNATIWSSALHAIAQKIEGPIEDFLQEGIKVRIHAQVTLFKDRGSISLNVLDIDPNFTKGALALARELLLKKLRGAGLDRLNKRLPPPLFALRIGLISANGSRAKSDFIHQLASHHFPGTIFFVAAQMQGEQTVQSVCRGMDRLAELRCDYIVITRGGGSQADLRWFDDEAIATKIAHCQTPVIAAIGHHEDVCIAEEVAHQREKTPTAAADFLLQRTAELVEHLNEKARNIARGASSHLGKRREQALQLGSRLTLTATDRTAASLENLERVQTQLQQFVQTKLFYWLEHLQKLSFRLKGLATEQLNGELARLSKQKFSLSRGAASQAQQLASRLQRSVHTLTQSSRHYLNTADRDLVLISRTIAQASQQKAAAHSLRISKLDKSLTLAMQAFVNNHEKKLQQLASQLTARDPTPWLEKGWTQLYLATSQVSSVTAVEVGDLVHSRLKDGSLQLRIESIKEAKK